MGVDLLDDKHAAPYHEVSSTPGKIQVVGVEYDYLTER